MRELFENIWSFVIASSYDASKTPRTPRSIDSNLLFITAVDADSDALTAVTFNALSKRVAQLVSDCAYLISPVHAVANCLETCQCVGEGLPILATSL